MFCINWMISSDKVVSPPNIDESKYVSDIQTNLIPHIAIAWKFNQLITFSYTAFIFQLFV